MTRFVELHYFDIEGSPRTPIPAGTRAVCGFEAPATPLPQGVRTISCPKCSAWLEANPAPDPFEEFARRDLEHRGVDPDTAAEVVENTYGDGHPDLCVEMVYRVNEAVRDAVSGIAIDVLARLGYDPDTLDNNGDEVGDAAQTLLMELLLRVPEFHTVVTPDE